jgi:hypothetical protein
MADSQTNRNIEDLRASLADKLEELHRRASRVTKVLTPSTYWNDPVVRFGLGVAIGLMVGSRGRTSSAAHEGLVHAIVRAGLTAATTALITRALANLEVAAPAPEAALDDPAGAPAAL